PKPCIPWHGKYIQPTSNNKNKLTQSSEELICVKGLFSVITGASNNQDNFEMIFVYCPSIERIYTLEATEYIQ
ncbi:hypothetical protein, partial [Pseudomonas aeruginosa]|uniref:hypothetical protein n=1 Tax=Pseudomonas aeruginosa TaxID=287 RepID=UPI003891D94E